MVTARHALECVRVASGRTRRAHRADPWRSAGPPGRAGGPAWPRPPRATPVSRCRICAAICRVAAIRSSTVRFGRPMRHLPGFNSPVSRCLDLGAGSMQSSPSVSHQPLCVADPGLSQVGNLMVTRRTATNASSRPAALRLRSLNPIWRAPASRAGPVLGLGALGATGRLGAPSGRRDPSDRLRQQRRISRVSDDAGHHRGVQPYRRDSGSSVSRTSSSGRPSPG